MKKSKQNYHADIRNANKGTSGQNKTHSQMNGNRGKQMNSTKNNANGGKK